MTPLRLFAALIVLLALPDVASAALTTTWSHTVARPAATADTVPVREPFDLVGVHWRGSGRVELRTHAVGGGWSRWRSAAAEPEDGPDRGSAEAGDARVHVGSPWWAASSDGLELRVRGDVTWARAHLIRSRVSLVPLRRPAAAGRPAIVTRAGWGADEAITRNGPEYAPGVRYAVVHHTAGANAYTKAEAPAIVRAIQRYHVQSNGWNDIGYNFLVDRFGTVYEGRFGGTEANVVGAHAVGFNTGSVGVALLGTYGTAPVAPAAERALARLLAWRLDTAHVDPVARQLVESGGSPKYAAGLPVTLRVVSGHRDVGLTECPGSSLYGRLAAVAAEAGRTGLPKLYEPVAEVTGGVVVSFGARLSTALPWTVTIRDAGGATVAGGAGEGTAVEWEWDASGASFGEYAWSIQAGSAETAVSPASGVVTAGGTQAALAVAATAAEPATVTPDGDGADDVARIGYTLTAPATVAVTAIDESGAVVSEVEPARWRRPGSHTTTFDPVDLPDGGYTIVIDARDAAGRTADARVSVLVTRLLRQATGGPVVLSPNGDGRADTLRLAFTLARRAVVAVRVGRGGAPVATLFRGTLPGGRHAIRWNGRKPTGPIRDGTFVAVVEARDELGPVTAAVPFVADSTPPRLRLATRRPPRLAVSEPASLRLVVNGAARRLKLEHGGVVPIRGVREVRTLLADAWDRAGNRATLRVRRPR